MDRTPSSTQRDVYACFPGVLADVAQCLLQRAEQRDFDWLRQARRAQSLVEGHLPPLRRHGLDFYMHGSRQPEVVEHRWSQAADQVARLAHCALRQLDRVVELLTLLRG